MITARLLGLAQTAMANVAPPSTSPPAAANGPAVAANGPAVAANGSPPAAANGSPPAAAPVSVLASVLAMINHEPRASPATEATAAVTTPLPASCLPGLSMPAPSTPATLAASVPCRANGMTETYAQRVASAAALPEKRGAQDSAQRERRVKIIQEMVRTVRSSPHVWRGAGLRVR